MPFGRLESVAGIDCAWYGRPFLGERVSGDGALITTKGDCIFLAMIDGMGHGKNAYAVASNACEFLRENWSKDLNATMAAVDGELQDTIGGAVSLCTIDVTSGLIEYAAVGNIILRLEGSVNQKFHAREGVVGVRRASPRNHKAQMGQTDLLIMHTDGISSRFHMADKPKMRSYAAARMAREIVEQFGKPHDDVTCMVLKRAK
ncbi:MAG: SpoIIE family protein phosphatase [Gammaproteobacteria bacterium]|jgi:serine phosphatase RsbU (regulator of sigma subunit)|nr:SpoIIE family protein phosphatase [Gammaproteobacteria bacterium]